MADDKRKKKRGRSKVFRFCFRSSAADEASSSGNKSDGLETKNGRLGKPVLTGKELLPEGKMVNGGVADSGGDCVVKRPSPRRRFSRVLKAVLFDSMKTKKKKIRRSSSKSSIASDTSESSSSSSEKIGKSFEDINACSKECADLDDSCSHSNLFSSSSRTTLSSASTSSSSSINSNSRWSSDQKSSSRLDSVDNRDSVPSNSSISNKSNRMNSTSRSSFEQKVSSAIDTPIISISRPSSYQKELSRLDSRTSVSSKSDKIKNGSIHWCLFLLLSLIVLVIWGRLFSILWTSISFYFVPRPRLKRVNSVPTTTEFLDFDSDQYKKKVIMAGLLDRTRPIR
ncbi:uncharacterized protein LOC111901020 [Lactuca sativa]|uniref:Uncharacterized protein n=1 Tax=Lactuca sativa TaxID=4236 RepID=A0A9R1UWS5_LACSA|nr:uncharacterized protein LOC111901020 [Lactuca sativa]KAJ0195592.1 hypothetical protein LSAT_V11C700384230 [Lactuca sativa]